MKKLILFVVVAIIFTSCGLEGVHCHSYGQTNDHTKHGKKIQSRYHSKHRRI